MDKETLTTIILDLAHQLGLDEHMIEIIVAMQNSRMGIYEFIGRQNGRILLKELTKDSIIECICPAGYQGKRPGELWFVRIFCRLYWIASIIAWCTQPLMYYLLPLKMPG
ncbi:hypothetical protein [Methylotuvimicrobium sp. KM2]|uniref:hypothetical protein n=1 Tax=Methylotuvimicrobium sp. KM2 TaxID=3133976 RepID=UPI003101199B